MSIKQTGDGGYIITRTVLTVPTGLTGYFVTKEAAQAAIDWYYNQSAIN